MTRRKGERPLVRQLDRFTPAHPVADAIATGDPWFTAWLKQKATPYTRLEESTGIPRQRFPAIENGGQVSRAEVDALARAWGISAGDLIASMPDATVVVE